MSYPIGYILVFKRFAMTDVASGAKRLPRILLAEPDYELRALWSFVLDRAGYEIIPCSSTIELTASLAASSESSCSIEFDLVVCDTRMLDPHTIAAFLHCQLQKNFPPLVMILALGDRANQRQLQGLNIAAVFDQPFDIKNQLAAVRSLLPVG